MYCTACGTELSDEVRYCHNCGTRTGKNGSVSQIPRPARRLVRPLENRKIAGVCAGIADYLNVDVMLIRVLICCLTVWPPGTGLVFYIVCWIVMPNEVRLLPAPPVESTEAQSARPDEPLQSS